MLNQLTQSVRNYTKDKKIVRKIITYGSVFAGFGIMTYFVGVHLNHKIVYGASILLTAPVLVFAVAKYIKMMKIAIKMIIAYKISDQFYVLELFSNIMPVIFQLLIIVVFLKFLGY